MTSFAALHAEVQRRPKDVNAISGLLRHIRSAKLRESALVVKVGAVALANPSRLGDERWADGSDECAAPERADAPPREPAPARSAAAPPARPARAPELSALAQMAAELAADATPQGRARGRAGGGGRAQPGAQPGIAAALRVPISRRLAA